MKHKLAVSMSRSDRGKNMCKEFLKSCLTSFLKKKKEKVLGAPQYCSARPCKDDHADIKDIK